MDTFILAVSTAVLFTLGYAVFWAVRAVRRVGPRRFARALGTLVWAVLAAILKLFTPVRREVKPSNVRKDDYSWGDACDDLRIAKKSQRISEDNSK
ncbi:MAG: hypothetical protein ACREXU_07785, partial [Gammaproteobacteria bacterium]